MGRHQFQIPPGTDPVRIGAMHVHGRRALAVLLVLCGAMSAASVFADPADGRRGPSGEPPQPQWQILRERHEIRRDVREDGMVVERRHVMRELWQQVSPEERQKWLEQRRQMRQLSPEERQQLRRDILEANRPPRQER